MSANFYPKYTTIDSVKVRLANKVQFQANPKVLEDGELPNELLAQLIRRAETKVELALRSRYAIPFRSKRLNTFKDLPDHTKEALTTLIDDAAVMAVLKTDFGRGTHINSEGYYKDLKADYDDQLNLLLGFDQEGENRDQVKRFRFSPPLEDLTLAASNKEADDGYKGMIINTDQKYDVTTYAEGQINDPSKSYLRRRMNGL